MSAKSVFCAITGLPNAGKSTLLNRLIGSRIAIVSPRPQTTRNRIMGVVTVDDVQYVLVDTPGLHRGGKRLDERMQKTVRESVSDMDCVVFLTTSKEQLSPEETDLLSRIPRDIPVVLALNKSDLMTGKKSENTLAALKSAYPFHRALVLSALTGSGVPELLQILQSLAKVGPHFYEEDTLTDQPEKVIVAELIREQLLIHLREELPHGCAVSVESFLEREDQDIVDIAAEILCEKSSHKGMIIGKGGKMLKKIGSTARIQIEEFLQRRVYLQLWVKVREDWRNDDRQLDSLGY